MNVKCLRKAYQRATIQSVQIDGEIKSMTEDQGPKNLTEATIKAEAAEQLRVEARHRLAQYQSATGRRWSLVLVALSGLFVLQAKAQTTGVYTICRGLSRLLCKHRLRLFVNYSFGGAERRLGRRAIARPPLPFAFER